MTKKNIAIIGAGYWGKNLVRNFHQLGVLKTICDGAQSIREEMSKTYPDVAITDDFNTVLKDKAIKGVVIAARLSFIMTLQKKHSMPANTSLWKNHFL